MKDGSSESFSAMSSGRYLFSGSILTEAVAEGGSSGVGAGPPTVASGPVAEGGRDVFCMCSLCSGLGFFNKGRKWSGAVCSRASLDYLALIFQLIFACSLPAEAIYTMA